MTRALIQPADRIHRCALVTEDTVAGPNPEPRRRPDRAPARSPRRGRPITSIAASGDVDRRCRISGTGTSADECRA